MPLEDYLDLDQSEDQILARMLAALSPELDKTEGGFVHDFVMPSAIELAIAEDRLKLIMDWGFAESTFGEYLDRRAGEHGLTRRAAVAAKGSVTFTGTNGTVIPAGTQVSTPTAEGIPAEVFATDAQVTITGGTATVPATAVDGGRAGNVATGTITIRPDVDGVTTVTNSAPFTGGLDEETDTELLTRYLQRVRNPGSSGNQADYVNWALEVGGVGGAACIPIEDGPGTVTVAIIDTDKRAASPALVASVQAYIAPGGANTGTGKAPIGATVTIEAATELAIDLAADLTIEPGYSEPSVRSAAEAVFEDYLESLAFAIDNDVRHAKVVSALLDVPGVADATNVTIEGGTANVVVGAKQIAIKGTVSFT